MPKKIKGEQHERHTLSVIADAMAALDTVRDRAPDIIWSKSDLKKIASARRLMVVAYREMKKAIAAEGRK
jgi:hypothetical protein